MTWVNVKSDRMEYAKIVWILCLFDGAPESERGESGMKRVMTWILALVLTLGLCACGDSSAKWQEQYDLGQKYLTEGNYEEAILAFTAAIKIDAKRTPAYVGRGDAYMGTAELAEDGAAAWESAVTDYLAAIDLDDTIAEVYGKAADAYLALGDLDAAEDILRKGYDATGDETLKTRLEELEVRRNLKLLVRQEASAPSGTLVASADYEYNEKGYITRQAFRHEGDPEEVDTWEYIDGECWHIPDRSNYDSDEAWQAAWERTYSELGEAKNHWCGINGTTSEDEYVNCDVTPVNWYDDANEIRAAGFKMDGFGNRIEYIFDAEGYPISTKTYDENGNFTGSGVLTWVPLYP